MTIDTETPFIWAMVQILVPLNQATGYCLPGFRLHSPAQQGKQAPDRQHAKNALVLFDSVIYSFDITSILKQLMSQLVSGNPFPALLFTQQVT